MDLSFLEELENEELRFKEFSLVGTSRVQAAGNLKAGYIVNVGGARGSGGVPPNCGDGCATDGDCSRSSGCFFCVDGLCSPTHSTCDAGCATDGDCSFSSDGCPSYITGICSADGSPTGACCLTPISMCFITTFEGCNPGIFHENISCDFVGSCDHEFCGPQGHYCACADTHRCGYTPAPGCIFDCCANDPGGGLPCIPCTDCVLSEVCFCCCCVDNPPFGYVCG